MRTIHFCFMFLLYIKINVFKAPSVLPLPLAYSHNIF